MFLKFDTPEYYYGPQILRTYFYGTIARGIFWGSANKGTVGGSTFSIVLDIVWPTFYVNNVDVTAFRARYFNSFHKNEMRQIKS